MTIAPEILAEEMQREIRPNFDASLEVEHVQRLMTDERVARMLAPYDYGHFIRAGGSGLVFKVIDTLSKRPRALKLSRKNAPPEKGADGPVNIDLELEALSLVS